MADRKITDLTALTTPASADVLPIVDVSEAAAADKNKKITVGELFKGVPDGTAAAPAIAFESDDGNGIFLSTTDTVGIATNGSSRMTVSTTAVTSTLPVIVPDGTAAAPSVAFTGSGTDTGVYSPGVDQVAISTNGTGRLFVDASGNIGVGVASPVTTLHLQKATGGLAGVQISTSTHGSTGTDGLFVGIDNSLGYLWNYENLPLVFGTNSTERLRITSDGKLGLGTSSPQSELDIASGTFQSVRTYLSSITDTYHQYRGTPDGSGYEHTRVFSGRDTSVHTYGSYLAFYTEGKASGTTDTSVERLRIDSSGRVGIGTTSPGALLTLAESVPELRLVDSDNSFYGTITSPGGDIFIDADKGNGAGGSIIRFAVDDSERARIDSSGRLLVGTSSDIDGSNVQLPFSTTLFRTSNATAVNQNIGLLSFADTRTNSAYASIRCITDGTPGTNDYPGRLVFSTTADGASSPTERMRIGNNGRVYIATTSQQFAPANLTVLSGGISGIVSRNNASGGWNLICGSSSNAGTYYFAAFQRHDTSALIGQITSVNGTSTTYSTTSDYRLKENVEPLVGAINRVKQLQPKRFNFIANTEETLDGFLAHEVDEVAPQAVIGAKDAVEDDGQIKPQCIDHSMLVPLLTAALQEAIAKIETLEANNVSLEARLAALEAN